jgi:hypothetical protein
VNISFVYAAAHPPRLNRDRPPRYNPPRQAPAAGRTDPPTLRRGRMESLTAFLKTFLGNPEALVTALVGWLFLIYTGVFRTVGAVMSRFSTPILLGYWFYSRSNNPNEINVTLNILADGRLDIDTIVADRKLVEIYHNAFIAQVIKLSARRTTVEVPVVTFPVKRKTGWLRLSRKTHEHIYEAVYNPLISRVSEQTNSIFSFMKSVGLPMIEYRFVLALTYEKNIPNRDQHFRCMMIWEETLKCLPDRCPGIDHQEYATRFRTLKSIAAHYARHPDHFGIVKVWLPASWGEREQRFLARADRQADRQTA